MVNNEIENGQKREFKKTFGTGTIILNPHRPGELYVVNELMNKEISGRNNGQLSIPLETAVIRPNGRPESSRSTLIASLAEIIDDRGLQEAGKNFFLVRENRRYRASETTPGVFYRNPIVIFDGDPELPFIPTVSYETSTPRLMPVNDFINESDPRFVRPLGSEVVRRNLRSGYIADAYRRYHAGDVIPLFPPEREFSIKEFQKKRDNLADHIIYQS